MPNKDRSFHESPQKAGGEGWLYSEQQQKLCYLKPDTATLHAQWVAIRTYSYFPPRPPERWVVWLPSSKASLNSLQITSMDSQPIRAMPSPMVVEAVG